MRQPFQQRNSQPKRGLDFGRVGVEAKPQCLFGEGYQSTNVLLPGSPETNRVVTSLSARASGDSFQGPWVDNRNKSGPMRRIGSSALSIYLLFSKYTTRCDPHAPRAKRNSGRRRGPGPPAPHPGTPPLADCSAAKQQKHENKLVLKLGPSLPPKWATGRAAAGDLVARGAGAADGRCRRVCRCLRSDQFRGWAPLGHESDNTESIADHAQLPLGLFSFAAARSEEGATEEKASNRAAPNKRMLGEGRLLREVLLARSRTERRAAPPSEFVEGVVVSASADRPEKRNPGLRERPACRCPVQHGLRSGPWRIGSQ